MRRSAGLMSISIVSSTSGYENTPGQKPTLTLAPVYDMLPMMWRPSVNTGELNVLPVALPPVIPAYAREQAEAREWAIAFWQQASTRDALDEPLREACEASVAKLRALHPGYKP